MKSKQYIDFANARNSSWCAILYSTHILLSSSNCHWSSVMFIALFFHLLGMTSSQTVSELITKSVPAGKTYSSKWISLIEWFCGISGTTGLQRRHSFRMAEIYDKDFIFAKSGSRFASGPHIEPISVRALAITTGLQTAAIMNTLCVMHTLLLPTRCRFRQRLLM